MSQVASVAIIITIIAAAFSGYAVGSLSQGTTQTIYTNIQSVTPTATFVSFVTESVTQTVTSTLTTAVTPSISQAGLQLEVNLNTTAIQYGSDLMANVELFNPLPTSLSLSVSYSNDQNIVAWNSKDFLCSLTPVYDLFGFALYQGYYTSGNISQGATPLLLTPQPEISCPTTYQPNISRITFPPENNSASVSKVSSSLLSMEVDATTEGCRQEKSGTVTVITSTNGTLTTQTTTGLGGFSCGPGSSLSGYWTQPPAGETCAQLPTANDTVPKNMIGPYCNLVSFPLGSYTLVAQDVWNQTVYAYFQVIPK